MDVVAEGVETSHQWDQLDTLGCEYGQGFYFSSPVDGPAAEALLAGRIPYGERERRSVPSLRWPRPTDRARSPCSRPPLVDCEKMPE